MYPNKTGDAVYIGETRVSRVWHYHKTRSYMPGLFESLKNMPKREPKKFFITVQGVKHEVTLEKEIVVTTTQ